MGAMRVIDIPRVRIDTPMPLRLTPGGQMSFVVEGHFDDGVWSVRVKYAPQPGETETVAYGTFSGEETTAEAIVVTNDWLAEQAGTSFQIHEGEMSGLTSVPRSRPGDEPRFRGIVSFTQVPEPETAADTGDGRDT